MPASTKKIRKFEKLSKATRAIEQEHAKIHDGDAHAFSDINTLASDGIGTYTITVPSSIFPHYRLIRLGATGSPFRYEVYEAPFFDANSSGTELFYMNMNRNSSKVTSTQVFKDAFTDTNSLGERLEQEKFTAAGVQGGGTGSPTTFEWLFAQGTNYLVRVINDDTTTESYDITTFMYTSGEGD